MTEKQLFANTKLEKPQIADEQQIIYLDFDGANTSYRNTILDLNLSVKVKDSGLTQERIDEILLELNRQYAADNVLFVSTIPVEEEFSTIYIGETESFKPYGEFYGLAETIDTDNLIRNDNAFVLMDQSHSNLSIISVIAHETDHIVKGIAHEEETVSVESSEMEDDSPVSKEPVSETLSAFAAKYELVWEDEDNFDMVETTYSKSAGTRHDYDNWYPEFYNGADKIVITITNKACYSSQYASSFSTSLKVDFVGQNDYRFAQLNVPLSITMYPDDNFSLKISQATVSLGTERQRTGSVTNHYTITVRHYKAKESGPVISISADTDSWTQSGVRVNANVSSGGHPVSRIEYSYDQVRWFNGGSVNMTYNGTVYFRATDTAGNVTNSSYTVSNIDYTAPNMEVYGSVLHWTTSKVGVTATAKDWGSDLSHIEYSYDNKNWRAGSFINMTYNGTIYFRATDHAGNTTTRSYTVRNIDNTAPNLIVEGNVSSWTKNNVVLTAQGSDWGSGLKNFAYSYDNKTWHSGSRVNMNYNGTIYFRATDNAGNLQTQSVTVSKIDKTAPTLQLSKSSTSWSRNSVWVTAYANDWGSGVKKIEYSYDNKNWKTGSSVNMDYNGTIYFRATDHAGNVSSSHTTVNSIDRSAPTINVIGNPTAWTNGTAVLTAQGSDWGSGIRNIEYSYDNWNWKTGSTVSMNYNGTIYFRATDNIGNTSSSQVSTSKFYGTPAVDIKSILNGWTNSSVPLWVSYTSDISKIEYSYDNRNWKTGNSLNMTYNGTIYFRTTDRWGNTKTSSYTVSNIDKTAPTLSLSGHTYDWNKGPLTIKVQTNDWGSGVKKIEYSYDGTKWFVGNTVNMDYSGWIHFRVTDNAGNTNSMSVPCYIDKTAPTLTVTKEYNGWTKGSVNFNASANDWGSGVKKIEYSYDNRNWQIGTTVNMNYNGTIYFRATDNAGNVTVESATMDK
ncbi:MAG: hypothetical protein J6W00_07515, partial [Lentisphaeria bacterium]|nr:hypothetical protein [Lentisphaeria bacterium]